MFFTTIIITFLFAASVIASAWLYSENQALARDKEDLEEKASSLEARASELARRVEEWEKRYSELEASYSALRSNYTALEEEHLSLSRKYSDLQESYSSLKRRADRLARDLNMTLEELEGYKQALSDAENPDVIDCSGNLINTSVDVELRGDGAHYKVEIKNVSNDTQKVLLVYFGHDLRFGCYDAGEPLRFFELKPGQSYSGEIVFTYTIPLREIFVVGVPEKVGSHVYLLHDPSIQVKDVQIKSDRIVVEVANPSSKSLSFIECEYRVYGDGGYGLSLATNWLDQYSSKKLEFEKPGNQEDVFIVLVSYE